MKKSWLLFFLPQDEFKEKKLLYFLAEALVLFILFSISFLLISRFFNFKESSGVLLTGIGLSIVSIYTILRYILSGIEYTSVFSKADYKSEVKKISLQSIIFMIIFNFISILFKGAPQGKENWIDIIGLSILIVFFLFLMNYISLKTSYLKNKQIEKDAGQ
ncbi:DUF3278 domain-containing protein [Viridibacillus sp. YIM B01967]|uniref:DUF3278 domain-containing protein n=1 Tax=Viridibacillus soli TaxID=2798301 RepID=A0ABS1H8N9_9BACL|nr:DUF3278 domain-containing protein [Viridibacillus soli]MBK3495778.1 DUF3278 domain-containing protein [Viridibacillus soli]